MSRKEVSLERKTCVIPERWGRQGGEALAAALLHSWARDASQLEEWIQRQEESTENRKFAYLFLRLDFFFFKGGGKGHEQHFQVQNVVYQDRKMLAVCGGLICLLLFACVENYEGGSRDGSGMHHGKGFYVVQHLK